MGHWLTNALTWPEKKKTTGSTAGVIKVKIFSRHRQINFWYTEPEPKPKQNCTVLHHWRGVKKFEYSN
jgi:hypothetical protein